MKTYRYFFILLLGCLLPACVHAPVPEPPGTRLVQVQLSLEDSCATKLGNLDYDLDEKPITRWAWFVFDQDSGALVFKGLAQPGESVTRSFPTGVYDIFAIGNYPLTGRYALDFDALFTRNQFFALKTGLEDNAPGELVMAGTTENGRLEVLQTSGDELLEASLHLQRLVSKITLESVTRLFSSATLGAREMRLKHVYLTNVCTESRYARDFGTADLPVNAAEWYNAMGWHHAAGRTPLPAIDRLVGERGLDLPLVQEQTTGIGRSFYYFPNPMDESADSHAESWAGPRCTRLVLETELGGRTYYYQATLPREYAGVPVGRNAALSIRCTLTKPGSMDPEQEIPGAMEVSFSSTVVNDWDITYTVNEES